MSTFALVAVVSNSVMPKGVEHIWLPVVLNLPVFVSNSVMPKGVEHVDASRLSVHHSGGVECRIQ